MKSTRIKDLSDYITQTVNIHGWISVARKQGKVIFFDIRDESSQIQGVVFGKPALLEIADTIKPEYVVSVEGIINKRPQKMVNDGVENGNIEMEILSITILNTANTPPFSITEDTQNLDEEVRLTYRYIDLRTKRMQNNLRTRSEFVRLCRNYLYSQRFIEIETPLLTESTPEGSRDFVVPSRHHPGKFYALPQSPQQYKQLLINSGFERYMQIARAIRDEDLRADRGFEHTQIDIEMAFVSQEDILKLIEGMIIHTVESLGCTIKEKPFPRLTYKEAMNTYGADKFDLRTDREKKDGVLAYAWVVDFPFFEKNDKGNWTFTHNPFSMPNEQYVDDLLKGKNVENIISTQYDLVCNGFETGGGSIRAHKPEIIKSVYKVMGYTNAEIEDRVGHMLKAFEYGTPPHGGIALGVERNVMNITGEDQLRDVQAFPMTRKGQTAVMKAPKKLTTNQLIELGIRIEDEK